MKQKHLWPAVLLPFLLSLTGCETPLLAYYPPTNPQDVVVTTSPYTGPHQNIKILYALFQGSFSNEQLAQYLQEEGAKVGADMVVGCELSRDFLSGTSTAYGTAIKILR